MTTTTVSYDSPSIPVHEVGPLTDLPSTIGSMSVHETTTHAGLDLLDLYLAELEAIPLLTQEQERTLLARVCAGDASARRRLIEAHLSLVVPIALRYARTWGSNVMELISAGNLGLTLAATAWKARSGNRVFSSEATCRIIEAISLSIADEREVGRLTSCRKEEGKR